MSIEAEDVAKLLELLAGWKPNALGYVRVEIDSPSIYRGAALVRALEAVRMAATKARDARWVQPLDYDKRADYNADMELGEALAAVDRIREGTPSA